ncbi:D-Ala-D-Ala carboxypeptidase family metallohydrolase [uncultured Cohaesibacter sp.]|uniref:D-Ala-D-Ala carboxypeptidase family metallohydrolase n=1 Tax=uncultured Cohaesibacter sp. TaxID=1002546 RepID=UPI0029C68238|nr:D-Ala-D-Ala carboxypeptidase family metallohydrolase [uncultured Cohaesibacter sp.]
MSTELVKLEETRSKLKDAIQKVGQSDLADDEKQSRILALVDEIEKLDILHMNHAASEINAAAQAVLNKAIESSENALSKILGGLVSEVRDILRVIRDVTPDPAPVVPVLEPTPAYKEAEAADDDPVLMRQAKGTRAVYGHLVRAIQSALTSSGLDTKGIDMIFGEDTEGALTVWRSSTGRDALQAVIRVSDWKDLTGLPEPDLFDICAQATAAFEGHGFGKIVGDFDGAVMTWGYHGFTLKYGHLQAVLLLIDQADPKILGSVFGQDRAKQLRSMLAMDLGDQIDWARETVLDGNNKIRNDWFQQFADLGELEVTRKAQLAYSRKTYWQAIAVPQAAAMGLSDPLSLGMLFDAAIQQGGASRKTVQTVKAKKEANPSMTEMELRAELAYALRKQLSNSKWAEDVYARRKTFITGRGRIHGYTYDLGYWGLFASYDENEGRLIPPRSDTISALAEPIAAQQSFVDFYNARVLTLAPNFAAKEFLFKGGSNLVGSCANLNTDPPEELWENVIELARLLQAIRTKFGVPVRISSCYRSPAYNRCIGGASKSQHMCFTAADITIADTGTPLAWYKTILQMRNNGLFEGGIGRYQSFIHVDVRGHNCEWVG